MFRGVNSLLLIFLMCVFSHQAFCQNGRIQATALSPTYRDIRYRPSVAGVPDSQISLDFYAAKGKSPAPLVVFIHGGGWQIGDKATAAGKKPTFFTRSGFAYASVNYRLRRYGPPDNAADDIAAALAYLRLQASDWGIDPQRIILMGHSAGAHLAALVALDQGYLRRHQVPSNALQALILLDGAGYNIARQVREGRNADLYRDVFGNASQDWTRLSPITYADQPNAPPTLAFYVATRKDSAAQSEALVQLLRQGGTSARTVAVQNKTHASIHREFGENNDPVAKDVLMFLENLPSVSLPQ